MQPARIKPHAKEHTNNPVQRPHFRGHAAGDVEVTRSFGTGGRRHSSGSQQRDPAGMTPHSSPSGANELVSLVRVSMV